MTQYMGFIYLISADNIKMIGVYIVEKTAIVIFIYFR